MEKNHYSKIAIQYADDILNNKILACVAVKQACKRFKDDLADKKSPFIFDYDSVEQVCEFAESLILPDTRQPLKLLPWQVFVYANLYGFVYKNNPERRRFRKAFVFVARKNGKTAGLLYANNLYQFLTEPASESYLISATNTQSEKSFQEVEQIIKSNPELDSVCNCWSNAITFDNSRLAFFSSETTALDGFRPNFCCLDEFWNFTTSKPLTAMSFGSRAKTNGLVLIITTAGFGTDSPCFIEYKKAKHILDGSLKDDSYFSLVYEYDEKDKWDDASLLIKSNPSIGTFLKEENILSDLNSAIDQPSERPDYIAKTCNRFSFDNTSAWIDFSKWVQPEKETDYSELKEIPCYGGLDLSSVNDLTAFTLCWKKEDKFYFKHRFYIPEETLKEKYKTDNAQFLEWVADGTVEATPGNVVDYEYLIEDIKKDCQEYKIKEIAFDRWMSDLLIKKLDSELPEILFVSYDQSIKNFFNPTKEYERLVYERKLIDPNPVMRWMLGNACIKPLPNGMYKPIKKYKSSTARIDGCITSIMALDRTEINADKKEEIKLSLDEILSYF